MWSEAADADLWQQKMPELRSMRKNNHIYEEMSCAMLLAGHDYTSTEIKIELHNFTNKYRYSIVVDMEPIYVEVATEGESLLPSPGDGPSTSRGCARPSSSDAVKKKKSAITIMEEIKDDLVKANEAMKEADEKRLSLIQTYINNS